MRAIVLGAFGAPPELTAVPEPELGADAVRVHVEAAAVHPLLQAIASGRHYVRPPLPVVLGVDGVGRTDAGERVYFGPLRPPFGALAERVAVPRALCTPIDEALPAGAAATLLNPGMAALLPLRWRAALQPGEHVCVLGATGAAGGLAVRLAKALGAGRVVAVGRSAAALAALRALGGVDTVALADDDAALAQALDGAAGGPGFDVVVDYLWGAPTQALLACLGRRRDPQPLRLVQVGEAAGPQVSVPGALLRGTGLTLMGFGLRQTGLAPRPLEVAAIHDLLAHAAAGTLAVPGHEVAPEAVAGCWGQPGPRLVVRFGGS